MSRKIQPLHSVKIAIGRISDCHCEEEQGSDVAISTFSFAPHSMTIYNKKKNGRMDRPLVTVEPYIRLSLPRPKGLANSVDAYLSILPYRPISPPSLRGLRSGFGAGADCFGLEPRLL